MKMYLAGEWVDRDEKIDVVNPFNGQVFDTVPRGSVEDVQTAIASADAWCARVMGGDVRLSAVRDPGCAPWA